MSAPNQNIIFIQKHPYTSNFLQIGNDEWPTAYKELTPSAFAIYLYLAGNSNGYRLELSQVAVENKLGIKKTAYHSAVGLLKEKGYIYEQDGKLYFTTVRKNELKNDQSAKTDLSYIDQSEFTDSLSAKTNSLSVNSDNQSGNPIQKQIIDIIDNNIDKEKQIGDCAGGSPVPGSPTACPKQKEERLETIPLDRQSYLYNKDMFEIIDKDKGIVKHKDSGKLCKLI